MDSVRRSLLENLSWHILSQDLKDAETGDENRWNEDTPQAMVKQFSDPQHFERNVGSLISLPRDLIEKFSRLVSAGLLLWSKSKYMTVVMVAVVLASQNGATPCLVSYYHLAFVSRQLVLGYCISLSTAGDH